MPSTSLHVSTTSNKAATHITSNGLPVLLQTPSGLAILEIQGTIHAPFPDQIDNENVPTSNATATTTTTLLTTPIGRLEFPFYDPSADPGDTKWMKRVYLYVGKYQRLSGEVKKLPKTLVAIGKREHRMTSTHDQDNGDGDGDGDDVMEIDEPAPPDNDLEVLEVIRYKILFGGRPEPVGD